MLKIQHEIQGPLRTTCAAILLIGACSLYTCQSTLAQATLFEEQQSAPKSSDPLPTDLISKLDATVARVMKEGYVPGLSVALIKDGQLVWQHGYGVINADTRQPVTDATVFEAASLSKPAFAYAVMKLVESGKIDLDQPLARYLPEPYIPNDGRLDQITARRVLSHTSGLPNWRTAQSLQIYFTPGERFSYSGEGYVYLQKVVERVTGKPLEEFMRETVFAPLGMTSSSYVWQSKYERLKAFSHAVSGSVSGRAKPTEANAAATLHTTAADYAKFVTAILDRKGLTEATVREMLRPQIRVAADCYECLEVKPEKLSETISWGLGWGLMRDPSGDCFWHWGDNGDTRAYVVAFDWRKTGVVIFANSANGLSIVDEIVFQALGVRQPQLTWLDYESYDSSSKRLYKDILTRGQPAIADYRAHRKDAGGDGPIPERRMRAIGYQMLAKNLSKEAAEIFRLNAEDYPTSANAFDGLGEAYMRAGDDEAAIKQFQRAHELDSKLGHATAVLKRLQNPSVVVEPKVLQSYVGRYEAPFGVLNIDTVGRRLWVQVGEDSPAELIPQSDTSFVVARIGARLTFRGNGKGEVSQININLGGEQFQAKRIK